MQKKSPTAQISCSFFFHSDQAPSDKFWKRNTLFWEYNTFVLETEHFVQETEHILEMEHFGLVTECWTKRFGVGKRNDSSRKLNGSFGVAAHFMVCWI